jgi:hypothetical protein
MGILIVTHAKSVESLFIVIHAKNIFRIKNAAALHSERKRGSE